jgi:hypothetical protein
VTFNSGYCRVWTETAAGRALFVVPIADRLAFPLSNLGRRRLGNASSGRVEPLPSLVVIQA